jgi:uncharacterized protein YgbK (DUF1537 family)
MIKFGCIADDLTGATDLANELVARGLRTVQVIGVPAGALAIEDETAAIVVALKSRSIHSALAVAQSLEALAWLREQGCGPIYFKYCSTFDSRPEGNIGPVLESLGEALGARATVACPAFPATGRTVYQGHLFVGAQLLNESGMEHHPLTPMRDANLVRVLQEQMSGTVDLVPLADVEGGLVGERLRALAQAGTAAVIVDAVRQEDLDRIGVYCASAPLSSGGSGLGAGIALALAGTSLARASAQLPPIKGRRAVIAGSCSMASRRQVAAMAACWPAYRILSDGRPPAAIIAAAREWISGQDGGDPILLYSSATPEDVAASGGDGEIVEAILAELAAGLVSDGFDGLIVAGGETSGAVVQRLGFTSLTIGPEIDPGVPWTIAHASDGAPLLLALKSGNFGSDDFFIKAWDHL